MEKAVNRLLAFSLLAALAFAGLTYKFRNAEHDSLVEETCTFDLCEYIDVDVSRMSVILMPYDGESITAVYTNDRPLQFEVGDNSLSIEENNGFVASLFAGEAADFSLYLYLPKTSYREIVVYTSSGRIAAGRVDSINLIANTGSGDIICDNAISRLKLSTTSGNMELDFDMVAEGCEINSANGDVLFTVPKNSSFTLDFDTKTGLCDCPLNYGMPLGTYKYVFNGGGNLVGAYVEHGTLTVREK